MHGRAVFHERKSRLKVGLYLKTSPTFFKIRCHLKYVKRLRYFKLGVLIWQKPFYLNCDFFSIICATVLSRRKFCVVCYETRKLITADDSFRDSYSHAIVGKLWATVGPLFNCKYNADLRSNMLNVCGSREETCANKQEVKVIWQKAPHGGPIPRLGATPGGRKLYHWIPRVGFPISVP